jgi:stage II sporulation protein R
MTAAFAALAMATVLLVSLPAKKSAAENENILRLHILANSDDPVDQLVKLKVRDALLKKIPPSDSAADAESYLLTHGKEILSTVETVLNENGAGYSAQLMLGRFSFPDRTYGDKVYPAGEYNALRILLGRAEGQNWWCVLFPPLCIVTEDAEGSKGDDDAAPEEATEGEGIQFESSILTWVRSWGNGA